MLQLRCLEIDYWTASRDEVNRRVVDPYHLTRIEDDWYLIGDCHLRQAMAHVRSRARAVDSGDGATFDRPADFRVESFLGDSFRVIRGEGRHLVTLRFAATVAGRVVEKLWHRSQTTKVQPDGSLLFCLEVSDLREVKRWVLGWGADCAALQPAAPRGWFVKKFNGPCNSMVEDGELLQFCWEAVSCETLPHNWGAA